MELGEVVFIVVISLLEAMLPFSFDIHEIIDLWWKFLIYAVIIGGFYSLLFFAYHWYFKKVEEMHECDLEEWYEQGVLDGIERYKKEQAELAAQSQVNESDEHKPQIKADGETTLEPGQESAVNEFSPEP